AVEDRAGIHLLSRALPEPLREGGLGRALGVAKGVAKTCVVGERGEALQLIEVGDPVVSDGFADGSRERRVRQKEPAAERGGPRLVVEALGEGVRKVPPR